MTMTNIFCESCRYLNGEVTSHVCFTCYKHLRTKGARVKFQNQEGTIVVSDSRGASVILDGHEIPVYISLSELLPVF